MQLYSLDRPQLKERPITASFIRQYLLEKKSIFDVF